MYRKFQGGNDRMVSVLGAVVILFYIGTFIYCSLLHKVDKCQWVLFNATIIINIFLGFGKAVFDISFIAIAIFLYTVTALLIRGRNIRLNSQNVLYLLLLVFVLFLSLVHLVMSPKMPQVILMDDSMDSVYYGLASASEAVWSHNNISSFRDIILMCVGLLLSKDYLQDAIKRDLMLTNIKKAFYVYFIIITFEFIINNLFSPTILRDMVYHLVGMGEISQYSKIWTAENRFGYYGVTGLFSEQSYIAVMIVFFAIVYVQGIKNMTDLRWFIYSILVLFMSGCTTGLMLIGFPAIIYIKDVLHKEKGERRSVRFWKYLLLIFVLILSLVLINSDVGFLSEILDKTFLKINAFLIGGNYNTSAERSAAIRYFANGIAWNAFFESPLFGVGIGTTRGYGILPGLFANFGILGIVSYFIFLKSIFRFTLKDKKMLLLVVIAYTSILLSVWYSYNFALIPLYAAFCKCTITRESEKGNYVKS